MKHHPGKSRLFRPRHRSAGKNGPAKQADLAPEEISAESYVDDEAAHGMTDEPSPERLRSSENPSLLW